MQRRLKPVHCSHLDYQGALAGRLQLNFSEMPAEDIRALPKNILELRVFYKTLDAQRISQTPKYTVTSQLHAQTLF